MTRLNKYIADAGVCSRREADKLILDGKIKVNDQVVITLGIFSLLSIEINLSIVAAVLTIVGY